jgi:transitional endoplasmic reticulum ATPase
MPLDENVKLEKISKTTHGFVGADLEVLCKEAAMRSLRRILPEINLDEEKVSKEVLQKIKITSDDFTDALREVRPSALREVLVQIPNVSWDDVGGLDKLKEEQSTQRSIALRSSWNWQDTDCKGSCNNDRIQLYQHQGPRTIIQVGWRIRERSPRDFQKGSYGSTVHHLL